VVPERIIVQGCIDFGIDRLGILVDILFYAAAFDVFKPFDIPARYQRWDQIRTYTLSVLRME